jgi:predicted Zn-dependent protease with MMP-like domain
VTTNASVPGELPEELWEALEDLWDLASEDAGEALSTFQSFPEGIRELREFQMALAYIEKQQESFEEAERRLTALSAKYPEDGDICHQLADLLEDMGKLKQANGWFLRTLELDQLRPALATPELSNRIEQAVAEIVKGLPPDYRERMAHVPLLIEPRPSREVVEEGLDPRALGLFEGQDHEADLNNAVTEAPTRIVLFSENLIDEAGEGPELEEEVAITVLHELGHYFGLDEEDMERLGLD